MTHADLYRLFDIGWDRLAILKRRADMARTRFEGEREGHELIRCAWNRLTDVERYEACAAYHRKVAESFDRSAVDAAGRA